MTSSNENPWEDQTSINHQSDQQHASNLPTQQSQNPWQLGGGTTQPAGHPSFPAQSDPWAGQQQSTGYAPPAGPPPGQASLQAHTQARTQAHTQAHAQAPTLPDETARFVPDSEKGEQREALEHFEMSHHGQQSADERNIETLTREFPKIDGALIAAIYGDSHDMGASREMLGELSEST